MVATLTNNAAFLRGLQQDQDIYMPLHALLPPSPTASAPQPKLEVGASVEFTLGKGGGRPVARNVKLLPPGTVSLFEFADEPCDAVVVRAAGMFHFWYKF